MSNKNYYYGLDNFAQVMETVMQNNVDTLIEAEQATTKPSLFKRLMKAARPNQAPTVADTTPQPQENRIGAPHPAQ
jgi:hypothetical protein